VTDLLSGGGGSSRLGLLLIVTGVFVAGLGLGGSGSGLGGLLLVGAVVRVGVGCVGGLLSSQHVLIYFVQAKLTTGAGTSVVGTASESESESSSSEDSSDELDSGVGSLTTFLDFLDS